MACPQDPFPLGVTPDLLIRCSRREETPTYLVSTDYTQATFTLMLISRG